MSLSLIIVNLYSQSTFKVFLETFVMCVSATFMMSENESQLSSDVSTADTGPWSESSVKQPITTEVRLSKKS